MSVDLRIYMARSRMPSAQQWSTEVRDADYGADLPQGFDIEKHAGFLPCKFEGQESGFEYYAGALTREDIEDMELEPDEQALFSAFDFSVLISIKGHQACDHKTGHVVAACLAKVTGGLLHDPQCSQFLSGQAAMAGLHEILAGIESLQLDDQHTQADTDTDRTGSWLHRLGHQLSAIFKR